MSGVDPKLPTAHLNLKWTVGDMDRLAFMRRNPSLSLQRVFDKLRGTGLECSIERLQRICDGHRMIRKGAA